MKHIRRVLDSAAAVAAIALATGANATTCETQVLLYGMNDVSQDNAGPDQIVRGDLGTGVCSALHTFNAGDDDMESLAWDPVLHVFWATNANILMRFDPLTYAETNVGDTGVGDIDGLAVQPGTGTLFAVNYGGNDLMTLDKNTAVATVLNGHLKEGHRLEDLAFDCLGRLWVLTSDQLVRVNPADGSVISSVPLSGATSMEALTWWEGGQTLLSAADRGNFKDLVRIDLNTGAATFLSPTLHSGFKDIEALALLPAPNVPVQPVDWSRVKRIYR
jgi:streptogramin lyase